ncbi:SAVED domain-containing protein [Escherichia coli]
MPFQNYILSNEIVPTGINWQGLTPVPLNVLNGIILDDECKITIMDWDRHSSEWKTLDKEDDEERYIIQGVKDVQATDNEVLLVISSSLRSGDQPHISGKQKETSTWLTGTGGGEVMKCKYTILCNNTLYDALQLARECMQLWDSYIVELKILRKND